MNTQYLNSKNQERRLFVFYGWKVFLQKINFFKINFLIFLDLFDVLISQTNLNI
jgi:hypothetical protein